MSEPAEKLGLNPDAGRTRRSPLRRLMRRQRTKLTLAAYAGSALLLISALLLAEATDRPLAYFTREPVEAVRRSGELCDSYACSYAGYVAVLTALVSFAACLSC